MQARFTFVSDSTDTQQDGWLMDNFFVMGGVIGSTSNPGVSNSIPVYPNPAKEVLQIDLEDINTTDSRILIFNATGQKVFEESLDVNLESHRISLNGFHPGIYFLNIQTEQGNFSQSFVRIE